MRDDSERRVLVLIHHPRWDDRVQEKAEGSLFHPFNRIKEQVTNNR